MPLFRYVIVRVTRHWQIVSAPKRIGLFLQSSRQDGAGLAREAQQSGHEVEIAVHQADGELVQVALPCSRTGAGYSDASTKASLSATARGVPPSLSVSRNRATRPSPLRPPSSPAIDKGALIRREA